MLSAEGDPRPAGGTHDPFAAADHLLGFDADEQLPPER
jgi:hypothetical protein